MRKIFWWAVLLGLGAVVEAKKPKIYRCEAPNGTIVLQDRRCSITDLRSANPKQPAKPKQSVDVRPQQPEQQQDKAQPRRQSQSNKAADQPKSPFFTFGWERFISANWSMHSNAGFNYQEILLSQSKISAASQFRQGIKLKVYEDTQSSEQVGAFAKALQHYHEIRDNQRFSLLDSQFKNHSHFKVFNIKYQQPGNLLTLTEFYIDEKHNDLFILTTQANAAAWSEYWDLSKKISNNL